MEHNRLKIKAEGPPADDLSFPPPYSEQAKYLALADKFLLTDGNRKVVAIESSSHFYPSKTKKGSKAA